MAHFELMRPQFAAHGICFIIEGISEIVSTDLSFINPSSDEDRASLSAIANGRPDCLNLFIHTSVRNLIGTAWGIPNNFISLQGDYVWGEYPVLASHEIGHALGLLHTFEDYYGLELVSRTGACSNCSTAGDLICDTQADKELPLSFFGNNCNYIGHLKDSCNNAFLMEPANPMSYNALTACRDQNLIQFTPGQAARMHYTIQTTPFLMATLLSSNSFTLTNPLTYSSGNHTRTYRTNYTINSPAFLVNGSARMQMSSEEIILKPGVTLAPASGMVVIRANQLCQ